MIHEQIHLKDRFPFLGGEGKDPVLKVYVPSCIEELSREDALLPGILICPGGGYTHCSQRENELVALHFLAKGYRCFVLEYSCSPHRYPTQLREVAAAMEVIAENAAAWNCDSKRIALMGFSAGGHLAAHYANCYDCDEVRTVFPESKGVKATVLCYAVISAQPGICHMGSFQNLTGQEELTPEQIEKFSIDRQVSKRTPPSFIWHTAEDTWVPTVNSLLYAQALSRERIPYGLHIYPYGRHGLATVDKLTNNVLHDYERLGANWISAAQDWLELML